MSSNDHSQPDAPCAVRKINMADLYPVITDVLGNGGTFSLTVTGSSMFPFLAGGRDQVTLSAIPSKLRKNDLPLYRRASGQFVLHRVVKVCRDGTYTCCGDHQWCLEKGLLQGQMIGVATEYVRKNRHFSNRNILYRIYRAVWTWLIPVRPYLFLLQNKLFHRGKKRDKKQDRK